MILVTSIQGPNSTNNQHGENNQNTQIKHVCHFTLLLPLVHCQPAPKTRLRVDGCQRGRKLGGRGSRTDSRKKYACQTPDTFMRKEFWTLLFLLLLCQIDFIIKVSLFI